MPYDIYLLTYPVKPNRFNGSRAHWGIYIPNKPTPNLPTTSPTTAKPGFDGGDTASTAEFTIGKVIHVTGTPFTGYGLEFKRNYDLASTGRGWKKYLLAVIDDRHVSVTEASGDDDGKFSVDVTPRDELERQALRIDPPGPSAEPLNPAVVSNDTDLSKIALTQKEKKETDSGAGQKMPGLDQAVRVIVSPEKDFARVGFSSAG